MNHTTTSVVEAHYHNRGKNIISGLIVSLWVKIIRDRNPTLRNIVSVFRNFSYGILLRSQDKGDIIYYPIHQDVEVTVAEVECYQRVFFWKLQL